MYLQADELFPQLYRCLKRDLQILEESEKPHVLLLSFPHRKRIMCTEKNPTHCLVYKLSPWDRAAMGMHLIYVLPHNDWTHRGQETQHWLMWKLTAYKITHWKLPFPKSANVRLSQTCKRVISFLITLFEPWDKETDDNYLPCFIYMVPNSVLHPIPKNYWEYCYRTFSHIGLFLLVLLSLSF